MKKETIKRLLALILVLTMALCCFAGCGSSSDAAQTDEPEQVEEPEEAEETETEPEQDEEADAAEETEEPAEETTEEEQPADNTAEDTTAAANSSTSGNSTGNSNSGSSGGSTDNTSNDSSNGGTSTPAPTPTPEPEPEPEPQVQYCTLSISCHTILNNMDQLTPGKEGLIPAGGAILGATQVVYQEGDTVYSLLKRELQSRYMHYEFTGSGSSAYLAGLCNIYEFDCGSLSGWEYSVNGVFPSVGMGAYTLKAGDSIAILYTCDLGADIGDPIG